MIITLDGPAASGKSSAAQGVADTLDLAFVSSGLLYRAATYLTFAHKVEAKSEQAVLELLAKHNVELKASFNEANKVLVDEKDISKYLHTDDVDARVSIVAAHPSVRLWVFERLREVEGSFVIEGRDMGSVVFPEASYKFYLTASAHVRAKRRVSERDADLKAVEDAIKARDAQDEKQLEPAPDAIHINTDALSLDEVIAQMLSHINHD